MIFDAVLRFYCRNFAGNSWKSYSILLYRKLTLKLTIPLWQWNNPSFNSSEESMSSIHVYLHFGVKELVLYYHTTSATREYLEFSGINTKLTMKLWANCRDIWLVCYGGVFCSDVWISQNWQGNCFDSTVSQVIPNLWNYTIIRSVRKPRSINYYC